MKELSDFLCIFAMSSEELALLCLFGELIKQADKINRMASNISGLEAEKYIDLGNNVFAFAIPIVNDNIYKTPCISIEHYYKMENLLKTAQGRRLFLCNEFLESGFSNDEKHQYHTKCKEIQNKVKKNGIIDDKVFCIADDPNEEHSIALSKEKFAQLILDGDEFANGFDFSCFQKIFDIIREICNKTDGGITR